MAPADFGRDIDTYQNWLCDVAGAYHYSGGGGGGASIDGAAGWNRNASIEGMLGYRYVNGVYLDRATDGIVSWGKVYNHYFNNLPYTKIGTFYLPYSLIPIQFQKTANGKAIATQFIEYNKTKGTATLYMHLWFTDMGSGLTHFNFLQTINTNDPMDGKKSPYLDNEDDSSPFYYKDEDPDATTREFIDGSTRPIINGNYWEAELSVVGMRQLFNYEIIQTLNWGFIFIGNRLFPLQITPTYPSNFQKKSLHH